MKIHLNPQVKKILKAFLSVFSLLLIVYILYKASIIFLPFLIAFIIASALEPIVKFLNVKVRLNKKVSVFITLTAFLSTIGVLIFVAVSKLVAEITYLSSNLNKLYKQNKNYISFNSSYLKDFQDFYDKLSEQTRSAIETNLTKLSGNLINAAEKLLKGFLSFANSIPSLLLALIVIILAIYFILNDKEQIKGFIVDQMPSKWLERTKYIIDNIFIAVLKYLKAQLILISISFFILLIGFFILDVKYALLIAFLACLVDALPVLGIGSFLVPWAIYQFIFGTPYTAIGLLIIYAVVVVVRQIMEPKIYGDQMGVHPLVAIIAMYIGLKYFGVLGLILSPITVMVAKNILDEAIKAHVLKDLFEFKPSTPANSESAISPDPPVDTQNHNSSDAPQ